MYRLLRILSMLLMCAAVLPGAVNAATTPYSASDTTAVTPRRVDLKLTPISPTHPRWKILILIYGTTDFTYTDGAGVSHHVIASMTPAEKDQAASAATRFVEIDIPALTSGNMNPLLTIRFPQRALTQLDPHGGGWWPSPGNTVPERDPSFDSVIVIWDPRATDQNTGNYEWIGSAAGLTPAMGTGQMYTTLIIEAAISYGHRNVFKHEWGHSILEYFDAANLAPKLKVENHAQAGQYVHCPSGAAYVWEDETEANPLPNSIYNNDSGFTHDYYSGITATADQPARCLGITPDAWAFGGPVTKPDLSPTRATGINTRGQVVGTGRTAAGDEHAFLWTAEQGIIDLGTLGDAGSWSWGNRINDSGQIVGTSRPLETDEHAVLWTAEHKIVDLGTLGGDFSQGTGINDRGQIVGESGTGSGLDHAFLWSAKTGMRDLADLGTSSRANAINKQGQVVGVSQSETGAQRAFLWDAKRGMVDLGTLGRDNSEANDINDQGQVVGAIWTTWGEDDHAFLWDARRGMVDLGTLGGGYSRAFGINNRGQVVGVSQTLVGVEHAFVWDARIGMVDLGALADSHSIAYDINDRGVIVGASQYHAVVWTRERSVDGR